MPHQLVPSCVHEDGSAWLQGLTPHDLADHPLCRPLCELEFPWTSQLEDQNPGIWVDVLHLVIVLANAVGTVLVEGEDHVVVRQVQARVQGRLHLQHGWY